MNPPGHLEVRGISPRVVATLLVTILAAGCSPTTPSPRISSLTPTTVAVSPGECPVTEGQPGTTPPPGLVPQRSTSPTPNPSPLVTPWFDTWYGNAAIWIQLPTNGVLPATPEPGKTTIFIKFPWFRVVSGQLTASGVRLDGDGEFSADVGTLSEYGSTGFVPSILTFDQPGCWQITGSLQGQTLSFVTRVIVQSQ